MDNDEYFTPKHLVDAVMPYFDKWLSKFDRPPVVWCPFDTKHSEFVMALKPYRKAGKIKVRYSHISDGKKESDFFKRRTDFKFDLIFSNPPFSRRADLIKRIAEIGGDFCLVLPLKIFEGKSMADLLIKCNLKIGLIIPNSRVSFNGKQPPFKVVFVCSKGFFDGVDLIEVASGFGKKFVESRMSADLKQKAPMK